MSFYHNLSQNKELFGHRYKEAFLGLETCLLEEGSVLSKKSPV